MKNRLDVAERAFRLLPNVVRRDHRAGSRIERKLAGDVNDATVNHALRIVAGGSRRIGCRDELHVRKIVS